MGKAVIRECRFSRIVKANTGYVEKKNNDGQSLPRVGKVASGASRIGLQWYEREGKTIVSSTSLAKAPYPPLFPTQSLPLGKADDTRIASAHKALRHRPPIYSRRSRHLHSPALFEQSFHWSSRDSTPYELSSNQFSDIKEKNLCV